jgi:hypothetical protein
MDNVQSHHFIPRLCGKMRKSAQSGYYPTSSASDPMAEIVQWEKRRAGEEKALSNRYIA